MHGHNYAKQLCTRNACDGRACAVPERARASTLRVTESIRPRILGSVWPIVSLLYI